jgi:hypothetical protein
MKKNFNNSIKGVFLFVCFAAIIIYVYKQKHFSFKLYTKSQIHELDRTFADQLSKVQQQTAIIKSLFADLDLSFWRYLDTNAKIELISQRLKDIERKYDNNSPELLSPESIEIAQNMRKTRETMLLAETINIAAALSEILPSELIKPAANSIDAQINQNQEYINFLMHHF